MPDYHAYSLAELGDEAAKKADQIGCTYCTQLGGEPIRAEVDDYLIRALDRATQARTRGERSKELLVLAAHALFGATLGHGSP